MKLYGGGTQPWSNGGSSFWESNGGYKMVQQNGPFEGPREEFYGELRDQIYKCAFTLWLDWDCFIAR